jgi:L-gulonate 5-dehydrogenase
VRAVRRGRVDAGERVVVLGAGPIGHAISLAARDRGAEVLTVDLVEARLKLSAAIGAEALAWSEAESVVGAAREWSGGEGAAVVVDATGAPAAVRAGLEIVASAGRFVQVGMGGEEVSLRLGVLTEKELDVLGVSVCNAGEFAAAVDLVERHADVLRELVTHEYPLERAPEAIAFAMAHPSEVMKVVIRGE